MLYMPYKIVEMPNLLKFHPIGNQDVYSLMF